MVRAHHLLLVFVAAISNHVDAMPRFAALIPNAKNVPNPCNRILDSPGVGHANLQGAGPLNPFGQDFAMSNFTWSIACPLDSDGDGMTNGQELGDPDCLWRPFSNMQPAITDRSDLTHPGVCEPLDAVTCKQVNKFINCDAFTTKAATTTTTTTRPTTTTTTRRTTTTSRPANPIVFVPVTTTTTRATTTTTRPCGTTTTPRSPCAQPTTTTMAAFPPGFVFCANNDKPWRVPTTMTEAYQCDQENPCPKGYGCVVGPTYMSMAICCPVVRNPPTTTTTTTARPADPIVFIPVTRRQAQTTTTTTTTTTQPPTPSPLLKTEPPSQWCFKDPELGPCRNLVVAWFYDSQSSACKAFAYGGCVQGSSGPVQRGYFTSKELCESTCTVLTRLLNLV